MYSYKLLFIALYLWSFIYAASYLVFSLKKRMIYQSVSMLAVCILGMALCIFYVLT